MRLSCAHDVCWHYMNTKTVHIIMLCYAFYILQVFVPVILGKEYIQSKYFVLKEKTNTNVNWKDQSTQLVGLDIK